MFKCLFCDFINCKAILKCEISSISRSNSTYRLLHKCLPNMVMSDPFEVYILVFSNTVISVFCICKGRGMKAVYAVQNTTTECSIHLYTLANLEIPGRVQIYSVVLAWLSNFSCSFMICWIFGFASWTFSSENKNIIIYHWIFISVTWGISLVHVLWSSDLELQLAVSHSIELG